MKKIGIIGGTFNPIHIGHLYLAEISLDNFDLDEIWIMPSGTSYMKAGSDILSGPDRYNMVNLAIDNEHIKCSDMEIKRQGNTYTAETLEMLLKDYPGCEFSFIYGADILYQIESWRNPQYIFDNANIIFAFRNGYDEDKMLEKINELRSKYNANIQYMSYINLEISSTFLRDKLRKRESVKYLIPDSVIDYIYKNNLYS